MARTTTAPPALSLPARATPRPRMRPRMAIVGVAIVVLFALLGLAVFAASGRHRAVLVLARTVPAGAVVTAGDLQVEQLSGAVSTAALPASAEASLLGERATTTLLAGSTLVAGAVARTPLVAPGDTVVAVALGTSVPAPTGMTTGSRVSVVALGTASTAAHLPSPGSVVASGTVVGIDATTTSAATSEIVSLAVPSTEAPLVALAAANGGVGLVLGS